MSSPFPDAHRLTIGVLGLGYVGLPLAVAFGRRHRVVGFDINPAHIESLLAGRDPAGEVPESVLRACDGLEFSSDPQVLADCNVYIVAVPTPIDAHKRPDLSALQAACATISAVLAPGEVVIFEATVYPGCTEEVCIPLLEAGSGLKCLSPSRIASGVDDGFYVGYSPERINPGDAAHSLEHVVKVTSGLTPETADFVDCLYRQIVTAGTHKASSIAVAEAAKVIENTQRDLNIALVNELALIFNRLGLSTREVLAAAGTKWNFLPFQPGLVGGHCIGVDPYYLTYKAEAIGYHPEIILAGRRINDGMGDYVAHEIIRLLAVNGKTLKGARCLVMGLTFKENCADVRNSRVVDIVRELQRYGLLVDVHDPWVDPAHAWRELQIELTESPEPGRYDALVLAVAHAQFERDGLDTLRGYGRSDAVFYDVKGLFDRAQVDGQL